MALLNIPGSRKCNWTDFVSLERSIQVTSRSNPIYEVPQTHIERRDFADNLFDIPALLFPLFPVTPEELLACPFSHVVVQFGRTRRQRCD